MQTARPAGPNAGEGAPAFRHLRDVIRHGQPRTALIVFAILVSLVEIAATLWYPILTKDLIDGLQSSGISSGEIARNDQVRLLVVILAAGAAAGGLSTYLLMKAGLMMSASLKSRLVSALLAKPVPYFDLRESGEHVSRVANDSAAISKLVTSEVRGLVTGVLLLIGSAIVLFSLDFELTLVIFGIILAAFVLLAPVFLAMAGITRRINDATAALGSSLTRIFSEIRLVKAFTAEAAEQSRSERAIGDLYASSLRSARIEAALQPVMSLALTFALLAIFTYGGARVALGTLSVGTLTAFILYIFNIVAPLIQLSSFASSLQAAKGASGRIHDILFSPAESGPPQSAPPTARPMDAEARDLLFEDVRLTYPGAERPALEIAALKFPAGTSTAVIGPSGSGKTSLLSLIERFYHPTGGAIYWGGEAIDRIPLAEWRAHLGYVAQTAPLMTGTVADNIAYGSPAPPDRSRMEQAARSANCLDFIARLDRGFDSQVGEGGVRLSGGQRQRLAIARIFMRNPSLLLLDEATSNLDVESEDAVRGALRRLMTGRTTIVVTHRLSMLSDVDFLAIVADGALVDFGPRAEIVAQSPYYRRVTRLLFD